MKKARSLQSKKMSRTLLSWKRTNSKPTVDRWGVAIGLQERRPVRVDCHDRTYYIYGERTGRFQPRGAIDSGSSNDQQLMKPISNCARKKSSLSSSKTSIDRTENRSAILLIVRHTGLSFDCSNFEITLQWQNYGHNKAQGNHACQATSETIMFFD
jgi:hypothetical protein